MPQVGKQTISEVALFLSGIGQAPFALSSTTEPAEFPEAPPIAGSESPTAPTPPLFAEISVGDLLLRGGVTEQLPRHGFHTLADVWAADPVRLARVDGLSLRSARTLLDELALVARVPPLRLRALSRVAPGQGIRLPRLPLRIVVRLAAAHTLNEEVDTLLCEVEPRNRELIRRRWGLEGPPPTLEATAPFGVEHAVALAFRRGGGTIVRKVGEHFVVHRRAQPAAVNAVRKMLAVTPRYTLEDVHAGLRRMVRSIQVPLDVLAAVLEAAPDIEVANGEVAARNRPRPQDVLSQSERIVVAAFENNGGALLSNDLEDFLTDSGFAAVTAHYAMRSPFLRQPKAGIYALRGRTIPQTIIRELLQKRRIARRRTVIATEWAGAGRLTVHYRLSRFLLNGVVGLPLQLRGVNANWRAVLGDEEERTVTLRNGFLWSLRSWLKRHGAEENDHLLVHFHLPGALLHVELIREGAAA
jgi:hypothetical protein